MPRRSGTGVTSDEERRDARTVTIQVPDAHRGNSTRIIDGKESTRYSANATRYDLETPAGVHHFDLK